MVQNKQKFNKINITAIITSFMLIMVFVFGCVQYAFASGISEDNVKSELTKRYGLDFSNIYYMTTYYPNGNIRITALNYDINKYDVYAAFSIYDGGCTYTACYKEKDDDVWYGANTFACTMNSKGETWFKGNGDSSLIAEVVVNSDCTATSNFPVYDMSGKTGNLSYSNIEKNGFPLANNVTHNDIIEYDSDIEVPLNLDIRLNGNSDFVPNVKISCNQTEQVEDRYLEVQYSIGYKATWRLLGGIGLNVKSKTSPTVYGSIEQLEDSFNNSDTSFETILSLSKLSHSVAPDEEAFSKYEPTPKVYWSLKEIKNDNSEMKIWCRNRVGNKASKWIMVSGDGYKANFDVVDSDENGNPTDMKDDTANSETGYGSDYWNNRDNTPQEDYSSTDVKNNLKDLKNNYISLANFFKELFGFLPTEIWIILIGLVSTMAIIAIVVFVRG